MDQSTFEQYRHIARLVIAEQGGTLTPEGRETLECWLEEKEENRRIYEAFKEQQASGELARLREKYNVNNALERVHVRLGLEKKVSPGVIILRVLLAAAAITLLVGIGMFFRMRYLERQRELPLVDIPAGREKAVLVTADGKRVELDEKGDTAFQVAGVALRQQGGMLTYTGEGQSNVYQQLLIPNGGTYQVVLADGSKVTLNAGSTLRFPVSFQADERRVTLTGEGFFDIARDARRPFLVEAPQGTTIRVLGTSFNVRSYESDGRIQAAVVSGKVAVKKGVASLELHAGEIAAAGAVGTLQKQPGNIGGITGWMKGKMVFDHIPIRQAMEDIARWYDVTVEYAAGFPEEEQIVGEFDRGSSLRSLLHNLEQTGIGRFKIEGRKVYISMNQ